MIRKTGKVEEYIPIEKINDKLYAVRWCLEPVYKHEAVKDKLTKQLISIGELKQTDRYSWMVEYVYNKPTLTLIQNMILSWYNKQVDNKILNGFKWNGMSVYLSTENQFNYKAAYDLAVQTKGANLPIVFKFGTTSEPVYYTFETVDDLSNFYVSAMNHINQLLKDGWNKKDSIDWSVYYIDEQ